MTSLADDQDKQDTFYFRVCVFNGVCVCVSWGDMCEFILHS